MTARSWTRTAGWFLTICLSFSLVADGCGAGEQAPSVVIPNATFQFPAVPAGRKVVHDFRIRNTGPAVLRILDVLTVENLKKTPGRYVDTILLTTDSSIQPTLKIFVYGDIF